MDIKKIEAEPANFSGSIPHHYEEYLGPMFFEPYAIEIAKSIESSSVKVVLELACGTGRVTRHLCKVIPQTSRLIASDISEDMMYIAKEKTKALNIEWRVIDAQDIPFDDNSIDLVVCCFGYMFASDKQKAFSEAYRVLKPGGSLVFSTWDRLELNAASYVYRKTVKKYLQEPVPETYKLPFSMNDDIEIRKSLNEAGFSKITIEKVDKVSVSPTAKEAAFGLTQGGSIYNEIMKRNPAWIEEIKETVEKELTEKFGAAPMIAPMSALITKAWK